VAIAAGCDDYVLKPVDYDRLENLIDSLLARSRPPVPVRARRAGHALS
jgi:DNA-binding response OmpR family regulator